MLNIFSATTSIKASGIMEGATDWHCHLLPGVDDGCKNLENTLKALRLYEQAGCSSVWLTPHVMDDMPNTPEDLEKVFQQVLEAYDGPIKLHLAAEHMLDALFQKRMEGKIFSPIGARRNHILVETSYFTPPYDFESTVKKIFSAGLFPVLAHPERYEYMNIQDYKKLKDMGVKFQLNLFSLVGAYNKNAQEKARKLLKMNYYDVFGTDTHRPEQLEHYMNLKKLKKSDIQLLPKGEIE